MNVKMCTAIAVSVKKKKKNVAKLEVKMCVAYIQKWMLHVAFPCCTLLVQECTNCEFKIK